MSIPPPRAPPWSPAHRPASAPSTPTASPSAAMTSPGGAQRAAAERRSPIGCAARPAARSRCSPADLNDKAGLAKVEAVLRDDPSITMLVNNAGVGSVASILQADVDTMEAMIDLNITALTRLTYAVAPAFVARGAGHDRQHRLGRRHRGRSPERRLQRLEVLCPELRPFAAEGSGRQGRARPDRPAGRDRDRVLGRRRLPAAEDLRDHHVGRGPASMRRWPVSTPANW